MGAERRVVPIEEAIRRIGRKRRIHTFMSGGIALLGCDHERDGLIANMREKGVEESGAQATAMGHTLVIVDYRDGAPLFIEAKPRAGAKEGTKQETILPSVTHSAPK